MHFEVNVRRFYICCSPSTKAEKKDLNPKCRHVTQEPVEGNKESNTEASVIHFKGCGFVYYWSGSRCCHGNSLLLPSLQQTSCWSKTQFLPADRRRSRITRSLSANTILNNSLSTFPGQLLLDKTLSLFHYVIRLKEVCAVSLQKAGSWRQWRQIYPEGTEIWCNFHFEVVKDVQMKLLQAGMSLSTPHSVPFQ